MRSCQLAEIGRFLTMARWAEPLEGMPTPGPICPRENCLRATAAQTVIHD